MSCAIEVAVGSLNQSREGGVAIAAEVNFICLAAKAVERDQLAAGSNSEYLPA
jgi:hypothetical protein